MEDRGETLVRVLRHRGQHRVERTGTTASRRGSTRGGGEAQVCQRSSSPPSTRSASSTLLKMVTQRRQARAVRGRAGTAKTTTIKSFMARFDPDEMLTRPSRSRPHARRECSKSTVEARVEKRQGGRSARPAGRSCIVFVDDISMPAMNDWGDQVTNEIVRQLLEEGGMYSLEKPIGDMKMIVDCSTSRR